jgi:hypothetical protein
MGAQKFSMCRTRKPKWQDLYRRECMQIITIYQYYLGLCACLCGYIQYVLYAFYNSFSVFTKSIFCTTGGRKYDTEQMW